MTVPRTMSAQINDEPGEIEEMDKWIEKEQQQLAEDYSRLQKITLNTLEIQRLPSELKSVSFCRVKPSFYIQFSPISCSAWSVTTVYLYIEYMPQTGLGAIIAGITRIAPLSVSVCFKDEEKRTVGLATFRTHQEATRAIERLKASDLCENWRMCLIANPQKK